VVALHPRPLTKYLNAIAHRDGEFSATRKGKEKDKEEWSPVVEQHKERLVELLELNFPEFSGRFESVWYVANKENVAVRVKRIVPPRATNPMEE
jgi:hypothetical protein